MKIRQIELSVVDSSPIGVSRQELIYLRRAWHLANMSTERQRHGAILISGRKTIAVGCNTFRNYPQNVSNPAVDCSYHAEHNVLKAIAARSNAASDVFKELAKSSRLYVVRINRKGMLMPSEPCDKCKTLLIAARIKEVVHS